MQLPNCRLFLVAPSSGDPQALAACLSAALAAGDAASLLLPAEQPLVQALMEVAREHDVAVLIDEDAEMARSMDADGVHLSAADASYALARAQVGSDRIVGADCQSSRHRAMELAEAGADYVMLDQTFELAAGETLIAWWASVMEVPCVAKHPADARAIAELARAGADFVRPADDMWTSPEQATAVIRDANSAIAEAVS
jgi:thiamine-phosphate pyrophosphorylase